MKHLDLTAVVAFLKANSEAPNDPANPYMQAIAQIDRLANAAVDFADGESWHDIAYRTGYSEARCKAMLDVRSDALAYLLEK
jgi:hypothetical protein